MAGSSKIPAGVKTFAGSKSSSDPLRKIIHRRETNKSSNSSVHSQRSPIQTSYRHTGSTGNSVKIQRKAGGSVEVQKSKVRDGLSLLMSCEENSVDILGFTYIFFRFRSQEETERIFKERSLSLLRFYLIVIGEKKCEALSVRS